MTKDQLKGLVVLMKNDKSLIQTKKVRLFQRENLVDVLSFLIPLTYEENDLTLFNVYLQYLDTSGTVHMEQLERKSDGQGGYDDYEDNDGNKTHMIMQLPVTSELSRFAGDISIKLTMNYTDEAGQTSSDSDNEEASNPTPKTFVLNTDTSIITILPVADYYAIVPKESMAEIDQKLVLLTERLKELETTATTYDREKADGIELHVDKYSKCLMLTSHGKQVGDVIDLNDLGDAIVDWQESGLIKVITDEDEPEPGPDPGTDEYADNIVLCIDESTKAIYLLSKGKKIGNPIYLDDLGDALADFTPDGLIKVITDDSENNG